MRRNRHRPAIDQLVLPLHDPPPESDGEPERPPAPRGWTPEGPVILTLPDRGREGQGGPGPAIRQ
jgi:hypothetical protein